MIGKWKPWLHISFLVDLDIFTNFQFIGIGATPSFRLPLALNYMSVLWRHGSSWKLCHGCSWLIKRTLRAWKHLWLEDCSMWFMWTFCDVERHGHPPDCRSPEELMSAQLPDSSEVQSQQYVAWLILFKIQRKKKHQHCGCWYMCMNQRNRCDYLYLL